MRPATGAEENKQEINVLLGGLYSYSATPQEVITQALEENMENMEPKGRAEILDTAKRYVTADRQKTHGPPEESFSTIASYWGLYLKREVSSKEDAAMMALLKIARLDKNPQNMDNWIDACGYLACGAEISTST